MSNSTDTVQIALLNNISSLLNRYITLFVFLFGTIGSLLNIIVLSQPILRKNPCVLYFLASSIASLGILLIGLPSRIIAGWIVTDPTSTSSWFCKLRIFLLYFFRTISAWLLVFATIDRWLSSNRRVHNRRFSSCKIAYKSILIIYLLSCILWAEALFCYDANVTRAPLKCYGKSDSCRIFNDIVYASSTVAIPSILMLIFGLLMIRNINRSQQAIRPVILKISAVSKVSRASRTRRKICLLTICSVPQAMHQFYLTFTIDVDKSPLRLAIENFIVNFNFSLTYVGNGISFYIYTLNGTLFRQTFIRLVNLSIRQLKCQ
ncbi:hypothetical protein I4U23_017690 [Adineta vaga]|nr:hypothetical protein I4U23_017690 [Adineta vaga]